MPRAPPHRAHTIGRGKDGTGAKIAAGKDSIELQKWTGPGGGGGGGLIPKGDCGWNTREGEEEKNMILGRSEGENPWVANQKQRSADELITRGTGGFSSFLVHPLVSPYFSLVDSIDSARGGGSRQGKHSEQGQGGPALLPKSSTLGRFGQGRALQGRKRLVPFTYGKDSTEGREGTETALETWRRPLEGEGGNWKRAPRLRQCSLSAPYSY